MTRIKKIKAKLGPRVVTNINPFLNPFLEPDGSLELIEKFVGIDFMPYEKKIKRPKIKRS